MPEFASGGGCQVRGGAWSGGVWCVWSGGGGCGVSGPGGGGVPGPGGGLPQCLVGYHHHPPCEQNDKQV